MAVLNSNGVAKWVVIDSNTDVVTGTTTSKDVDDVYVHTEKDGNLTVTTTKNLTARQVSQAIRDHLNDSEIATVTYDAKNKEVTIEYRDGDSEVLGVTITKVGDKSDIEAAELMNKVQDKISSTYGSITVEGNKMTADGGVGSGYLTDPGSGTASKAVEDFAEYLKALHEAGAKKIVYDNGAGAVDYTWDDTLTLRGSRWAKADHTTLVSVVTTKVTADLNYAGATAGDVCEATVNLTVDGNDFIFVIKVTKGA